MQPALDASNVAYGESWDSEDETEPYMRQREHMMQFCESLGYASSDIAEKEEPLAVKRLKKDRVTTASQEQKNQTSPTNKRRTSAPPVPPSPKSSTSSGRKSSASDFRYKRWVPKNPREVVEQVQFHVQEKYRFKEPITKNVYLIEEREPPEKSNPKKWCLKFTHHAKEEKRPFPMELRVLSHIAHLPKKPYLQQMREFIITEHGYGYIAPFVPALTDQEETCVWNEDPLIIQIFMRQLLIGLRTLHKNGIIHRDIKPSNLLWDDVNERLTIADYGHSTWITPEGHFHRTGTDGFMAPEVLRSVRDSSNKLVGYSTKADMFSVGMVFGGLLFGIEEDAQEEFHASLYRELAPKYLSPSTASLLVKLLRRNPQKRLSAGQALNTPYFKTVLEPPVIA